MKSFYIPSWSFSAPSNSSNVALHALINVLRPADVINGHPFISSYVNPSYLSLNTLSPLSVSCLEKLMSKKSMFGNLKKWAHVKSSRAS